MEQSNKSQTKGQRGEKRQHKDRGKGPAQWKRKQPKRGGPGVLLTCEAGRERKCLRDALEMLRYYYYKQHGGKDPPDAQKIEDAKEEKDKKADDSSSGKPLTLEEEVAMLKKGATSEQVLRAGQSSKTQGKGKELVTRLFEQYDTGCRGILFLMFTGDVDEKENANEEGKEEHDKTSSNKRKLDQIDADNDSPQGKESQTESTDNTNTTAATNQTSHFDPLPLVMNVITDAQRQHQNHADDKGDIMEAPSSRFITRMIPMQITCFANINDVAQAATRLVNDYMIPLFKPKETAAANNNPQDDKSSSANTTKSNNKPESGNQNSQNKTHSFEIVFKRRNCSALRRETCISTVAEKVPESSFRVDLKNPDCSILVEVCRNIVGMSVVPKYKSTCQKFNLFEIGQNSASKSKS